VTRPAIAELMGAYGAALTAQDNSEFGIRNSELPDNLISLLLSKEELEHFTHDAKPMTCGGCTNRCSLTVNTFGNSGFRSVNKGKENTIRSHDGSNNSEFRIPNSEFATESRTGGSRRFISGNRCSKPLGAKAQTEPNLMKYKYALLRSMQGVGAGTGKLGRIGIPLGLNMFENLPFWFAFLTKLDFEIVLSRESSRELYTLGQRTIPSDTVCYPAKLMHGHIESLLDMGVDTIFLPCMPYNFDEGISDNNYNCPVVAYYPELLAANMPRLKAVRFLNPYFGLHRKHGFILKSAEYFKDVFDIPERETKAAAIAAYAAYADFIDNIEAEAKRYIEYARGNNKLILVVAGRPYHVDPEVNHGIDELITSLGLVLITEDAIARRLGKQPRRVLNQWTYQARMYNAARYALENDDMQLVQLISFGCGTDAITADELRSILESGGKLYTQLKIDDINNLGAVKIRLRSLIAALGH